MAENLMNSEHKATTSRFRLNYDMTFSTSLMCGFELFAKKEDSEVKKIQINCPCLGLIKSCKCQDTNETN